MADAGAIDFAGGAVGGGAVLRPGPLGQRTPPPVQGGTTTAQAGASREPAQ